MFLHLTHGPCGCPQLSVGAGERGRTTAKILLWILTPTAVPHRSQSRELARCLTALGVDRMRSPDLK